MEIGRVYQENGKKMESKSHTLADSAKAAKNFPINEGARIIVETLLEQGVDTVFGYTGA